MSHLTNAPYRQVEIVRVEECGSCLFAQKKRERREEMLIQSIGPLMVGTPWIAMSIIACAHFGDSGFSALAMLVGIGSFIGTIIGIAEKWDKIPKLPGRGYSPDTFDYEDL